MIKYHVYYMNNDRQKIIIQSGLSYMQAVGYELTWQFAYNTGLYHEME